MNRDVIELVRAPHHSSLGRGMRDGSRPASGGKEGAGALMDVVFGGQTESFQERHVSLRVMEVLTRGPA